MNWSRTELVHLAQPHLGPASLVGCNALQLDLSNPLGILHVVEPKRTRKPIGRGTVYATQRPATVSQPRVGEGDANGFSSAATCDRSLAGAHEGSVQARYTEPECKVRDARGAARWVAEREHKRAAQFQT